jgi:hypothetical protein
MLLSLSHARISHLLADGLRQMEFQMFEQLLLLVVAAADLRMTVLPLVLVVLVV